MSTSALIIEVMDTEREQRQEYVFARSPIRVGRSPLNDLPIDRSFVSHWHGVFHFERGSVEFIDVGSTNGTSMNGVRLEKNRRMPVPPNSTVAIGGLRLRTRLEQRDTQDTRSSYAFRALSDPPAAPRPERPTARDSGEPAFTPPAQRVTELTERFARSFLELRRGQQQVTRDLGLISPREDPLQRIDDAAGLLAYLLDPAAPAGRLDELSRAFADLMMHEVALLQAFQAGTRELLDELSPHALVPRRRSGLFAWLPRLLGRDPRWVALEKRHEDLREETTLLGVVLGRSFSRAYSTALGHRADPTARSTPPKDKRT